MTKQFATKSTDPVDGTHAVIRTLSELRELLLKLEDSEKLALTVARDVTRGVLESYSKDTVAQLDTSLQFLRGSLKTSVNLMGDCLLCLTGELGPRNAPGKFGTS